MILLGKSVIEHDSDRLARVAPCTYVYPANDLRLLAVAFRSKHRHRPQAERASVTLRPLGEAWLVPSPSSFSERAPLSPNRLCAVGLPDRAGYTRR